MSNRELFIQHFGNEQPAVQAELLLAYADTCGDHFQQWLAAITQPETPAQPVVAQAAATEVQQTEAFFTRSLQDAAIAAMEPLRADITTETGEKGTVYSTTLQMNTAWWDWVNGLLAKPGAEDGVDPDGGKIGGWTITFPDGAICALAIYNSQHGPFVDAFVRLPNNAPDNLMNPSIEPRKQMDAAFVFEVEGLATYKVTLTR